MSNYLTTDTELNAVADAIRVKSGADGLLTFPAGFISAIETISAGSSEDFSPLHQDLSKNNIGGLFTAFDAGSWGYVEKSFSSGTNPLTVDFGRPIKGFFCYPKNITAAAGLTGESAVFGIAVYQEAESESGAQSLIWSSYRGKSASGVYPLPRIKASGTLANGVFSAEPSFPNNQNYHPFGFNKPYIFVFWW